MTERNRNLALRVGSALLLSPLLILVTWLGGLPFALMCAIAAAVSAAELVAMFAPLVFADALVVVLAGLAPLGPWWANEGLAGAYPAWLGIALAAAAMAILASALFRGGKLEELPLRLSSGALAWIYCGFLVAAVVAVRVRFGFGWTILLFAVTWLNDSFAYFAGRLFGRRPMFPRISPKKTWEGFAGGVVGSIGSALFLLAVFPAAWLPGLTVAGCVVLGAGAAVVGPIGDLAESMLKRAAGVKDSGTLIPGHGGLLDRIDALLFVAPWVYLFAAISS